jgi:hypothetical protein
VGGHGGIRATATAENNRERDRTNDPDTRKKTRTLPGKKKLPLRPEVVRIGVAHPSFLVHCPIR